MPSGGKLTRLRRRRRFRNKKKLAKINAKIVATGGLPFKTLTQYRKQRHVRIVHAPEAPPMAG